MLEKLKKCFTDTLAIEQSLLIDSYSYGSKGWDSVAHMALIAAIEEAFDIMMNTEDVIDMSSFEKAKEIISKYGVNLNA